MCANRKSKKKSWNSNAKWNFTRRGMAIQRKFRIEQCQTQIRKLLEELASLENPDLIPVDLVEAKDKSISKISLMTNAAAAGAVADYPKPPQLEHEAHAAWSARYAASNWKHAATHAKLKNSGECLKQKLEETEQRAQHAEQKAVELQTVANDHVATQEQLQSNTDCLREKLEETEFRAHSAEQTALELQKMAEDHAAAQERLKNNGECLKQKLEETELRAQGAELKALELQEVAKTWEEATQRGQLSAREWSARFASREWKNAVAQIRFEKKEAALQSNLRQAEEASISVVKAVQPLQRCIEDGDALELQRIVEEMKLTMSSEEQQREVYGAFASVVVPFYEAAESKLRNWQGILNTMRAVVKSMEPREGESISRIQAKRLFNTLREASATGMVVQKTDLETSSKIVKALLDFHVQEGCVGNSLQAEIIQRICSCKSFLEFDFADMSACLSFADKTETSGNEFFMSRARALVETHQVHEFKEILTLLDTVLFFFRFMDKEDIALTYKQYHELQPSSWVTKYINIAEKQFRPGQELVRISGRDLHSQTDLDKILDQLQESSMTDGLRTIDGLKPIFYWWAKVMMEKFSLLVLPHHTQVVCLLMCLEFIKGQSTAQETAGALIAEMDW